jgi:hypothetical protein
MTTIGPETDAAVHREAVRQQVLLKAAERWNNVHGPGVLRPLTGLLHGSRNLKSIFIVEHEGGDVETISCWGNAIAAWRHDSAGLQPIDAGDVDPGSTHGHIIAGCVWDSPIWRFYIPPDNQSVILIEEDAPGFLWLARHSVVWEHGRASLKFQQARRQDESPFSWYDCAADVVWCAIGLTVIVALMALIQWLLEK